MNKTALGLLLAALAPAAFAGFLDSSTPDKNNDEVKVVVPTGARVTDVTNNCVIHLKENGYQFVDKADADTQARQRAEDARRAALAAMPAPQPNTVYKYVYVEKPLSPELQRYQDMLDRKKQKHGKKKVSKPKAQPKPKTECAPTEK